MPVDQYRIHETAKDRTKERSTLQRFVDSLCRAEQTDPLSGQDAKLFLFGRYAGIIEIKHRNNPIDKYPTYAIDKSKIHALLQRAKDEGVHAYLLISWQGDVRYVNLTKHLDGTSPDAAFISFNGQQRHDRDEFADDVYNIPTSIFKSVDSQVS